MPSPTMTSEYFGGKLLCWRWTKACFIAKQLMHNVVLSDDNDSYSQGFCLSTQM